MTIAARAPRDFAIPIAISAALGAALQFGMQFPLLNLTLDDWGVSEGGIGLFTLSAALSTLLIAPVTPWIIERLSARGAIAAALVVMAVAALGYHVLRDVWAWFGLRFLNGMAFGVIFVASEAWLLDRAPERLRGRILGLYASALASGLALGATFVALVGHRGPEPYVILVALAVVSLIPLLLPGTSLSAPDAADSRPSALWARVKAAPVVMAAPLAMGAIETAKYNLLPIYARRVGFTDEQAAMAVTTAGLGVLCLQLALGALADRIGARRVLLGCAAAGVVMPAAIWAAGGALGPAFAAIFVYSGLVTGLYTIGLIELAKKFSGKALAAANAAYAMAYGLGQVLGPALTGFSFGAMGPPGFLAALAAPSALFLALALAAGGSRR